VVGLERPAAMAGADVRPERYTDQIKPQEADPACTPISRGTKSSNPLPSQRGVCELSVPEHHVIIGERPEQVLARVAIGASMRRVERSSPDINKA
jgi:hypothetical protein